MAAERNQGLIDDAQVEQRGEAVSSVRTDFNLIREFKSARLA
jgi:hypothetical protein